MYLFTVALHVVLCLCLILVILVQPGKGADVGMAFGGMGGSTIFGPRGPGNVFTKATAVVAVLFIVTSITLAKHSSPKDQANVDVGSAIERLQQEEAEGGTDQP